MDNKFAIPFNRQSPYLDEAAELIIKYHPSKNLPVFLQEHQDQRIVLDIANTDEFLKMAGISVLKVLQGQEIKNWVLRLPTIPTDEESQTLRDAVAPFFVYTMLDRWEQVDQYIHLGVTDIYATNELAFQLDKLSNVLHDNNIKLRVCPNFVQSAWKGTPDIKKFWIRPEDIIDYESYVDVFEINVNEPSEYDIVAYKAYVKDKRWYGDLREFILGMNDMIDSKYLHPRFADRRTHCGKKCLKGGMCSMCDTMLGLSQSLAQAEITVERPEEKKEYTEEEKDAFYKEHIEKVDL